MEKININEKIDASLKNFSANLKQLLEKKDINQQDFSEQMGIAPSTLSGYLNGKQPKYSFLITLKSFYPEINIDDLLFNTLQFDDVANEVESVQNPTPSVDLEKYCGAYYLYYIDTSKRDLRLEFEKNGYPSLSLKYAILYIDNHKKSSSEASCLALFGVENRQEAKRIKDSIDESTTYKEAYKILKNEKSYSMYTGSLHASQHLFLSLFRTNDTTDNVLIILHNTRIHNGSYFGGLGTVNSISTGRESDPIVQLIAMSREYAYISDEQIKSNLWFARPEINVRNSFAASEILRLTKSLYSSSADANTGDAQQLTFSEKNIETLISSYLEYLVTNNLENIRLWYGRVSEQNDDDWYHILSEAESFQKSNQR